MQTTITIPEMRLSEQAMGAIMMALQRSLLEQSDIVPILSGFKFVKGAKERLIVLNPPIVKAITREKVREFVEEEATEGA